MSTAPSAPPKGQLTALAPWFGAKRRLAPEIVRQLGPHRAYFEPFAGSMAVLFNKPRAKHEVVNDLNRDVANVAACLQSRPLAADLLGRLHFTVAAEELYREARAVVRDPFRGSLGDPQRAHLALVVWWLGRSGLAGVKGCRGTFSARFSSTGGALGPRLRSLVASVPWFAHRLAGVDVLNRDAFDVLAKVHDRADAAVYCDPPYVVKGADYVHDFAAGDHARLAAAVGRFQKARVVVSYYPHPALDSLYPAPKWHRVELDVLKAISNTRAGRAGTRATEVLFVNGDPTPKEEPVRGK